MSYWMKTLLTLLTIGCFLVFIFALWGGNPEGAFKKIEGLEKDLAKVRVQELELVLVKLIREIKELKSQITELNHQITDMQSEIKTLKLLYDRQANVTSANHEAITQMDYRFRFHRHDGIGGKVLGNKTKEEDNEN